MSPRVSRLGAHGARVAQVDPNYDYWAVTQGNAGPYFEYAAFDDSQYYVAGDKLSTHCVFAFKHTSPLQWVWNSNLGIYSVGASVAVDGDGNIHYLATEQNIPVIGSAQPGIRYCVLSPAGSTLYDKLYYATVTGPLNSSACAIDSSGHLVVSSPTTLMRIAPDGSVDWALSTGSGQACHRVVTDVDDNIYSCQGDSAPYLMFNVLSKVDSSGTVVWCKRVQNVETNSFIPRILDMVRVGSYIYCLASYKGPIPDGEVDYTWVFCIDTDGDIQWLKSYGPRRLGNIRAGSDGTLYVTLSDPDGIIVMALDGDGVVQWARLMSVALRSATSLSFDVDGDDNLLIGVYGTDGSGVSYFCKIRNDGTVVGNFQYYGNTIDYTEITMTGTAREFDTLSPTSGLSSIDVTIADAPLSPTLERWPHRTYPL